MPRAQNISVQNNFIKGLITEATGLTFPENACTDTLNCEFDHLGNVTRRLGFDFEGQYTTFTDDLVGKVVVTYLWNNVGGDGDEIFVISQTGNTLHFYKVDNSTSLSQGRHASTINLTDFVIEGITSVATLECQFASGNGRVFVTNRRLKPFYIEFNPSLDAFTAHEITIQIRDFEGDTADTLTDAERPAGSVAALTAAHRYNLENQGWTAATLAGWDTARSDMPSNVDVSWYFKNGSDAFDFTTVKDRLIGNSKAPRGHYIYDVFNISRSSHVTGATDFSIALESFTTTAFFAGRVFYSGVNHPTHSSRIYFSKIVESVDDYGKCYQVNDPTSEKLFDLLPTDGGVIDILEAGSIVKMVPVFNNLLVFCRNGIWSISGSQGQGFAANDYALNKISSIVTTSHTSFVDVEGIPFWWCLEGIYTITADKQSNALRVQSVTDQSIRKFYLNIDSLAKSYARGAYDPFLKKVHWGYRTAPMVSSEDKYVLDSFLIFNTLTSAFYTWSVDPALVKINSLVNVLGLHGTLQFEIIMDGSATVVDGSEDVFAFVTKGQGQTSVIKYFTSFDQGGPKTTWSQNYQTSYRDWESFDGQDHDYDSYLVSGYILKGKAMTRFQENYFNLWYVPNSACKVSGRWDYATSGVTGRWSTAQLVTSRDVGFAYKKSRLKIRGHGLSCQFKIDSHQRNPFTVIGWSTQEGIEQAP